MNNGQIGMNILKIGQTFGLLTLVESERESEEYLPLFDVNVQMKFDELDERGNIKFLKLVLIQFEHIELIKN